MKVLLHGVKETKFDIFHGDTLLNEWDMMREHNPAKKPSFDASVGQSAVDERPRVHPSGCLSAVGPGLI